MDPLPILAELGVRNPTAIRPVSGGFDTALWRVECEGQTYALRVFRADQTGAWGREAAVMPALLDLGLRVPRVHAAAIVDGRPALLLSWCEGATVLSTLQRHPWRVWQLGLQMGRMQAAIHSLPVIESVARSLPVWTPQAANDPQLEELLQSEARRTRSVLHLDYHPLNILSDRRRITCVLDWPNAAIGDPRADLARSMALFRLAPGRSVVERLVVRLLERAWLSGYRERRPRHALDKLDPFCAWAGRMTEADLAPKLGRPGVWLTEDQVARLRHWTAECRQRVRRSVEHQAGADA